MGGLRRFMRPSMSYTANLEQGILRQHALPDQKTSTDDLDNASARARSDQSRSIRRLDLTWSHVRAVALTGASADVTGAPDHACRPPKVR